MPTFDEAVKKAVRVFYDGQGFDNYEKKTGSSIKYNIDYFDDIEPSYKKKKPKTKSKDEEGFAEDIDDINDLEDEDTEEEDDD